MEMKELREVLEAIVEHRQSDKSTVLERHAQTILVGLVTVGIIFVSSSITSQNADIKVLQVQNSALVRQMAEVKRIVTATSQRYVTQGEFSFHADEVHRRLTRAEQHIQQDEQGWRSGPK
jgi:Tfp pilus assembly protein PilN